MVSSRGCKEEEVLWAVHDYRDRSCSFRAAKRAASHLSPVRRDKGALEGPESRAAKAVKVSRGSVKLQARVRMRVR
ncbi:hypothetical protein FOXYSP1_16845 [Fusarium oxysporum f. sp. phaseoli]